MITCQQCHRAFADERALLLHFQHDVKAGSPDGRHAYLPARSRR